MNTKPTIKEDIYQQQSKIIETLRETIKQQAERLNYLEDVAKECRTFRGAFRSGQTTYSEAMQQVLTAQQNQMQQVASQKRAQSESERLIKSNG